MIIEQNKITGGFYTIFKKDGQHFFADLSIVPMYGPECMIFPCDKDGHVTNWNEVYARRFDTMDIENLQNSVNEFMQDTFEKY